jgi:hypothetical protein
LKSILIESSVVLGFSIFEHSGGGETENQKGIREGLAERNK